MKAITLRNLPAELAEEIEMEAKRANASLNATVIRLLQEALGQATAASGKKRDLSDLGGGWSTEEADAFDRQLAEQRTIDVDMWKSCETKHS